MKLEWKDTTHTHTNRSGETETFEAREAVGTGLGYVIYQPEDDEPDGIPWYAIIHMPSKSRLHRSPCLIEEQAKRTIVALLPLINWNRPLQALTADPEYQNAIKHVGRIYDEADKKFWETLMEHREEECWPEAIASA